VNIISHIVTSVKEIKLVFVQYVEKSQKVIFAY